MDGKVIGLTSAIKTRSGGFQGVGLAVSSKLAKTVAEQLVKNGVVRRPYLGVRVSDLDDATAAKKLKVKPNAGVVVTEVFAKSPGEKANIGVGDVITTVNGVAVAHGPRDAEGDARAADRPGGRLSGDRATGKLFLTKVTVEEQPDAPSPSAAQAAARP